MEENSIINEINEELKNEQLFALLHKHRRAVFAFLALAVVGIIVYSSWYNRRNAQMEEITTALVNILRSPTKKSEIIIAGLMENAPAEIKPILAIMKSGRKLLLGESISENLDALLELSKRHGVDLIWKDLALIIYASHSPSLNESIKLLEPLASEDRPFRFTALEIIALMHENMGRRKEACENFQKIIDAKEVPNSLKRRVSMLLNHLKNLEK
ncbi:MAG: hypothetical protein LBP41_01430 [Holosporaceae bacterium]|jgi:hypothetical protein|nr:hypothetical protein [Holosporaceae bacterium]